MQILKFQGARCNFEFLVWLKSDPKNLLAKVGWASKYFSEIVGPEKYLP